jgi:Tol biopolymer transport system component
MRSFRHFVYFVLTACAICVFPAHAATVFSTPVNLGAVNSNAVDAGPAVSADGLTLFFHSDRAGGMGSFDLYTSSRATINDAWGAATSLGAGINTGFNDRAAEVSADGLTLYFSSDRNGDQDIYMATRSTRLDPWSNITSLSVLNSNTEDAGVTVSADGLTMAFHSNRVNGISGDLFTSTRTSTSDLWGAPISLGSIVNSSASDVAPSLSADGLSLYFHSSRPGSQDFDIWHTSRTDLVSAWGAPVNLGSPINSSVGDVGPDISFDGGTLYFGSDRNGTSRDLYSATVVPLPAAVWLFGAGLVSLICVARRKNAT